MIHTAEEIRKKFDILIDHEVSSYLANKIEKAINEARKQLIEEISQAVNYPYRDEFGCHCDVPSIVNQFLDQIK